MNTLWIIIQVYLGLSLSAGLVMIGRMIYDDYFRPNLSGGRGQKDLKFGYNFRGRKGRISSVSLFLIFVVTCPIINLFPLYISLIARWKMYKHETEDQR